MRRSLNLHSLYRGYEYYYNTHRHKIPLYRAPRAPIDASNKLHATEPDLDLPLTPADLLRTALCTPSPESIAARNEDYLCNEAEFLKAVNELTRKLIFADVPGISRETSKSSTLDENAARYSRFVCDQGRLLQLYELAVEYHEDESFLLKIQRQLRWAVARDDSGFKPQAMLRRVNALTGNLQRKGYKIHPKHYMLGLHWAARAQAIDAFHRYLEMYNKTQPRPGSMHPVSWTSLMMQLMKSLTRKPPDMQIAQIRPGASYRRDLYRIITGDELTNSSRTIRAPLSMSTFVKRDKPKMFRFYLSCLAELGAVEEIWAEWLTLRKLTPHQESSRVFSENLKAIVLYLYIAGEEKRALEVFAYLTRSRSMPKSRLEIELLLSVCKRSRNSAVVAWRKEIQSLREADMEAPLRMIERAFEQKG